MENEEKRVLIVEDDATFVGNTIKPVLRTMGIKESNLQEVNNARDAISVLENGYWNLVILDLGIFESKESSAKEHPKYGMEVFKRIKDLNKDLTSEMRVVVLSGSIDDEDSRALLDGHDWVASCGKVNAKRDLPGALDRAFKKKNKTKNIEYPGFSKEVLEELRKIDKYMYNHLNNNVLVYFKNNEFMGAIIDARQLLYCIRGGFSDPNFNSQKFLSNKGYPDDVGKPFDYLTDKGIRPIDVIYTKIFIEVRNTFKGDQMHKPTRDDAAVILQLLVPIVRAYVNFKKGKIDGNK